MKNGTNTALDRNRPFHGTMKRAPFSVLRSPFSVLRSPLTHRILFLSFSVAILALAGCFSPYSGDEGNLTITLPGGGNSRAVVSTTPGGELDYMSYEITVGSVKQTFGPGTKVAVMKVVPGKHTVTVKCYVDKSHTPYASDPAFASISGSMLRGYWEENNVPVGGSGSSITAAITSATEVTNWAQLDAAVGGAAEATAANLTTPPRIEYIFINGPITQPYGTPLLIQRDIILKGSETITGGGGGTLFGVNIRTLTIDGPTLTGVIGNTAELVNIQSTAELVLQSGAITGNTNTGGSGGGVHVQSGGTFTMSGGHITGNGGAPFGGGVYVAGTFTMSGGNITGNNAAGSGGGVTIYNGGSFTMSGGTITLNTPGSSSGGGVFVNSGCALTITSPATSGDITSNVFSDVYNNGGTITGGPSGGW